MNGTEDPPMNTDATDQNDTTLPKRKTPDIRGFLKGMGFFIYHLLLIAFLGAGFRIMLIHYGENTDNTFPGMDIQSPPYSYGKTQKGGQEGPPQSHFKNLESFFDKFFPMGKWTFPYKNYYSENKEPSVIGTLVLWITESMAYSNQIVRQGVGTAIESLSEFKNNGIAFWLFGGMVYASLYISLLVGLITGYIGPLMAINRIWVGWPLFAMLCIPLFIPAILYIATLFVGLTGVAYFQSLYTFIISLGFFLVFPFSLTNSKTIFKETFSQRRNGILRGVLIGAIINAFRYLGNGFGIGGLLLFALTLIGLV